MRNRVRKAALKTQVRRFTDALKAQDANVAADELRAAMKKIDQIAAAGTLHKNAAARKKSRLAIRLNRLNATGK